MHYISYHEKNKKNLNKLKVIINNNRFIKKELKNTNSLFNNINGYCLDINQRKAIITNEDSILLLASAGAGKTLTIVGKIRYLIEVLHVKKEDILCISFTNDAVNSLKKSLLKNYNYDVDVFTFHKLSMNILKNNNKNISICESSLLEYVINEFFYRNIENTKLLYSDNYIYLKTLISTFINLYKSNNYSIDVFNKFFKNMKYSKEYILLKIIKEIYIEYEEELKSTYKVDFNDMINKAIDIIKNNGYIKPYKYIIIDEYQDTSYTKYLLINEIKQKYNSKIFVVGDDYQSIYRFTGCNLDIFLNFKKYYPDSRILSIINTYRNSQELINISGKFIMKNKNQIRKKLNSNKNNKKPIKVIYSKNLKKSLFNLLDNINTKILILGRNNNDIYNYFKYVSKDGFIKYKNKTIRYLTVHKSKGLEEDNVIIINLSDDIFGFPSKIQSNDILKYVLNEKDIYPYEEERRLFYVALTRTKNNVYFLVNKNCQSIFVTELLKDNKYNIDIYYNKIY